MVCQGVSVVRFYLPSWMDVFPPTEVLHLTILCHLREHLAHGTFTHLDALRAEHLVDHLRPQRLLGVLKDGEDRPSSLAHPVLFGVAEDRPGCCLGVPLQRKLRGVLNVTTVYVKVRICLPALPLQH